MLEHEKLVLACILLDRETVPIVSAILRSEMFVGEVNRRLYTKALELYEMGDPIESVTLDPESKNRLYLLELETPSSANAEYYARQLREDYVVRELEKTCMETVDHIRGRRYPDLDSLLDNFETKIFKIADEGTSQQIIKVSEQLPMIHEALLDENRRTQLKSGFLDLDYLTGGFASGDNIIVAGRPSMGKCLGKGTGILMYDGSIKSVENIRVGDLLMGDDSNQRKVLSTTQGREMMYWVRQLHGIDYRVNKSHVLSLKRSRGTKINPKGEIINIGINEYLKKCPKFKTNYKGYKTSVNFEYKELPIEPYFLGIWLGDGSSANSRVHTQDNEVVEYLNEYAIRNNSVVSKQKSKNRCPCYIITNGKSQKSRNASIQNKLRRMGVLNNKHIPSDYIINDRSVRLQLLAGLVDSDGHKNRGWGGTIEITSKYENLAKQIKFLCDTLGYRTSIKTKKATIKSIGFECLVWRVRFNGNVDEIPVRVKRKKGKEWKDRRDWKVTGVSVETDKIDDYYGFEIDGNGLFLLEDCTVTHNTAFCLSIMRNVCQAGGTVGIFSLETTAEAIVRRLVSMVGKIESVRLRNGMLTKEEKERIPAIMEELHKWSFYIDDSGAINTVQLKAKARRAVAQYHLDLLAIDYLQLIHPSRKRDSRNDEVSEISRTLRELPKDLGIPIIAVSQLSRATERRESHRPQLSDLRESGSIEQDATIVLFVYRPEMYRQKEFEDGTSTENKAEIVLAKQKDGATGDFKVLFQKEYTNFENLAPPAER